MILCCGEALYDFFLEPGAAEWPQLNYRAVPGGSPFNVAVGLARLSRRAALLTPLSNDYLGAQLRRLLEREGVDGRYLLPRDLPTTLAMVSVDEGGQPQYGFYGERAPEASLRPEELPTLDDEVAAVHFGSYALVGRPGGEALQALAARESGRRLISLDPNLRLNVEPERARWRQCLDIHRRHAHLIKVSAEDLALLYPGQEIEACARRWLAPPCQLLLLTRGEQGVRVFSRRHGEWEQPAAAVQVVDTVGAGDSFQAALLCRLAELDRLSPDGLAALSQAETEDLVRFATRAAALTCARRGPDLPRREQLAD